MSKILLGWLALNNDLIKPDPNKGIERGVNIEGPNYQFHKSFYDVYDDYTNHIVLYSNDTHEPAVMMLINKIQNDFPSHQITPRKIPLESVIDINEIKQKVESLLLEYRNEEVDIFFSPGTSAMQVAWYICHTNLGLKTRLLQTVSAKVRKDKKPDIQEIKVTQSSIPVSAVIKQQSLEKEDEELKEKVIKPTESMTPVLEKAYQIAQTDLVTCLITGESGTGKELMAKYIWENSPRKTKPFDAINCSALGDDLLESRLFGHKKGSFTGAENDMDGLLKKLNDGTVFLDEIGDISPRMQQSLLRFLQEGEIQPIGGSSEKIDVRIIAATNKDLLDLCRKEKFRWDLYYRLVVTEIHVPSLRERGPEEADELFEDFLDLKKKKFRKPNRLKPDPSVIQYVKSYSWPGNIRELENFVESLYVFCTEKITMNDIPQRARAAEESTSLRIEDVEADLIRKVLRLMKGNKTKAKDAIGWSINTLKSKMEKYGIDDNGENIKA